MSTHRLEGPQIGDGPLDSPFIGVRRSEAPSRWHIRILRAVRAFGKRDKIPGIVAVYATAVHHVGRDLLLRLTHIQLVTDQMSGRDCGLGRLVLEAVGT